MKWSGLFVPSLTVNMKCTCLAYIYDNICSFTKQSCMLNCTMTITAIVFIVIYCFTVLVLIMLGVTVIVVCVLDVKYSANKLVVDIVCTKYSIK